MQNEKHSFDKCNREITKRHFGNEIRTAENDFKERNL